MRARTWWLGGTTLATALVSSLLLTVACSGPSASTRSAAPSTSAHPQVDTGLATCADCHAQATPEVVTAWRDGPHGLSLVDCVVCHGSTGADFKARADTTGCSGCHAVQTTAMRTQGNAGCFSCHPAHALHAASGQQMPHPAKPKEAVR